MLTSTENTYFDGIDIADQVNLTATPSDPSIPVSSSDPTSTVADPEPVDMFDVEKDERAELLVSINKAYNSVCEISVSRQQ
jgi:hypothetical protein